VVDVWETVVQLVVTSGTGNQKKILPTSNVPVTPVTGIFALILNPAVPTSNVPVTPDTLWT
jgi:hypothetical protein